MKTVTVLGKFMMQRSNGDVVPVTGHIEFIPSRFWVETQGKAYATLHASVELDHDGGFVVPLTPTHGHGHLPWHYTVICPVGRWTIKIEESDNPVQIRKLLPSQFSG